MALYETTTNSNRVYLKISDGKLCQDLKEPKEGYTEVQIHNPKTKMDVTKYRKTYSAVSGMVTGFNYGAEYDQWSLVLTDDGMDYHIQFGSTSNSGTALLKMISNVDITKPLRLSVSMSKGTDGKERTSPFLEQDGEPVKWAHTNVAPNGLPPAKELPGGKKDRSDQNIFLHAVGMKFADKVNGSAIPAATVSEEDDVLNDMSKIDF